MLFNNIWFQRIFWSAIVVAFAFFIYHLVSRFLKFKEKHSSRILSDKKNKTFIRMLKSIVGYALGIFTILVILQIFGVDVSSMLAGVGIASIVVGFALQDAMKDIFRGFDILSDGYYEIGDVIKYENTTGQVLSITLRTTKIRDLATNNVLSIANRNIVEVEVVSGCVYIPIPFPYEVTVAQAEEALKDIIRNVKKDKLISDCKYQGLTDIADSSLNYQILITTDPASHLQARRNALRTIVTTLSEHKITIPYNQLDVHAKK